MPSITVTSLRKTFQTKRKAAGLSGSVRALICPEYSNIEAVRGLSFQMEKGELRGFSGPNGAVPADFIRGFSWTTLAQKFAGALIFLALAIFVFSRGLRRYESGSAIQTEV